jgi:hypothetical protein
MQEGHLGEDVVQAIEVAVGEQVKAGQGTAIGSFEDRVDGLGVEVLGRGYRAGIAVVVSRRDGR